MDHTEKIELWREFLKTKGWRFRYPGAPEWFFKKITGRECSPSYFWPFWSQVAMSGTSWGLFWGTFMFFSVWRDKSFLQILIPTLIAGFFFGLFMAMLHQCNKRKSGLSTWEKFGEGTLDHDNRA